MAPSVGTEILRIAGTPEALAPGKGVREGLWRITGTRAMRARRRAAEAALGGREGGTFCPGTPRHARPATKIRPVIAYILRLVAVFPRVSSRVASVTGRFLDAISPARAHRHPQSPRSRALPFGVISAVCGKSPHFPGLLAGALRVPSCHRRDTAPPCFDARPREIPQGDPSSWANPSEPL